MLEDAVNLESVRRVLLIKLRHHGDVLLCSPLPAALKSAAPHLEIDALVYAETAPMLSGHPALANLFSIDRGGRNLGWRQRAGAEWALVSRLRAREYDLVIHLTEHSRGAWLTRMLGPRYAVASQHHGRPRWWRNSFTHLYALPRGGRPRHRVELDLDALRRIGLHPPTSDRRLVLVPGALADQRAAELLAQNQLIAKRFVHIHAASRWQFKCWPADRVAQR